MNMEAPTAAIVLILQILTGMIGGFLIGRGAARDNGAMTIAGAMLLCFSFGIVLTRHLLFP
jgi:hypothetical protein